MPVRPSRALRASRVRADSNILVEGTGDDYGWVSNQAGGWVNGATFGDWPTDGRPHWWLGSDVFDGNAIGPHGPGDGSGYGWDPRARLPHGGWWNRPTQGAGLLPAVTRCTEVIVSPVVRTPWVVDTPRGSDTPPLWVADPQLAASTPGANVSVIPAGSRLVAHNFWTSVLTSAVWWGQSPVVMAEDAHGHPLPGTLRELNPFMVASEHGHWVIDPHGEHPVVTDFDGRFELGGETWRLVVVRGLPPHNSTVPEGVLVRHFDTLRLGAAVTRYSASTFASGVPSGFLKVETPNATQADLGKVKSDWMRAHGAGKREIAVLNATVSYTPISISPVDADVAEVARGTRIDVAHAFGLSSAWLDTGDASLTYANVIDRRRDLVDTTLTSWGQSLMDTLSALMPYGTRMRVNWPMFTSPQLSEQIGPVVQAVTAGIMSPEEARVLLGLQTATGQIGMANG